MSKIDPYKILLPYNDFTEYGLVDAEDERYVKDLKWHWHSKHNSIQHCFRSCGHTCSICLHRFILIVNNIDIRGKIIHHRNGIGWDNQKSNLQITNTRTNNLKTIRSVDNRNVIWNNGSFYFRTSLNLGKNLDIAIIKAYEIEKLFVSHGFLDPYEE